MPGIPFFDSHSKGVDIFIKKFKETYRLDNRFILSVDVKCNFVAGKGMSQSKARLLEFYILEFLKF